VRCSSDRDDPGYPAYRALRESGLTVRVYLDGAEVREAVMADEEGGVVARPVTTVFGDLLADPDHPDKIWTETLVGEVEIDIVDLDDDDELSVGEHLMRAGGLLASAAISLGALYYLGSWVWAWFR
jgi:hypothetical protein